MVRYVIFKIDMMLISKIALVFAIFLLSLITGLFYSYSVSVNPGLAKLSDGEYLRAMQSINRAILNPLFFLSFIGSLVMMPICTWLSARATGLDMSFYLLMAATILYVVGVFGVTIFGNVPLNEALDKFNISTATAGQLKNQRLAFEGPWNKLHLVRTVCNALSMLTALAAIVKKF